MRNFDYVIVGGGSAGCAVAGRLCADPAVSVCLVEAGPPDTDVRIKVPLGVITLMGHRRFDWCFKSEPHAHLARRVVSVPRGRTLGGSGSINSMVYIRGRASDFDRWAESGCVGWDWKRVLERYKRSERNARGADEHRGDAGPLHVEDLPSPHPMTKRWIAAGRDEGIPPNPDFNGPTQEGLGVYQATMHRGRRWSPADAYLRPAMRRPNLTVVTGTLVDRVLFDRRRAVGVHALGSDGSELTFEARAEVILCAGTIASPAILMRSGVGPGALLSNLGVDVVKELGGVGENLHDHPAFGMHYGGGRLGYALSFATMLDNCLAPFRYLVSRSGLLASNTVEAGGFARTLDSLAEPDVQFHFIPARLGHEGKALVWGRGYYSDICVLKPRSRGRLLLASADPADEPLIDLNLLASHEDEATMLRGAKLLRRILASPKLKTGDATELVPGPAVDTDDHLRAMIHERLGTAYHPVGTCRMGADNDSRSVVDPQLRVVGLENVRVADASIMPEIIAGNTNAASMMIGEAAVEFIRTD